MIVGMKKRKPSLALSTQLRYDPRTKQVLERLIADLKASGRLLYFGEAITQEALINASWLFMEGKGIEWIERELGPYVSRLESLVRESDKGGTADQTPRTVGENLGPTDDGPSPQIKEGG